MRKAFFVALLFAASITAQRPRIREAGERGRAWGANAEEPGQPNTYLPFFGQSELIDACTA
jgi:hypothetical protein